MKGTKVTNIKGNNALQMEIWEDYEVETELMEKLKREAYKQAYKEGYRAGYRKARRKIVAKLEKAIQEYKLERDGYIVAGVMFLATFSLVLHGLFF